MTELAKTNAPLNSPVSFGIQLESCDQVWPMGYGCCEVSLQTVAHCFPLTQKPWMKSFLMVLWQDEVRLLKVRRKSSLG